MDGQNYASIMRDQQNSDFLRVACHACILWKMLKYWNGKYRSNVFFVKLILVVNVLRSSELLVYITQLWYHTSLFVQKFCEYKCRCLIIQRAQRRNPSVDPVSFFFVWRDVQPQHKVGGVPCGAECAPPRTGLVHRTRVGRLLLELGRFFGFTPDQW